MPRANWRGILLALGSFEEAITLWFVHLPIPSSWRWWHFNHLGKKCEKS
jgi:uncharacterized protein YbdZ (MbtH family)